MSTPDIHSQIMNLRCEIPADIKHEPEKRMLMKVGHRDARRAAAELVLPLQERVKQLEEALQSVMSSTAVLNHLDPAMQQEYCDLLKVSFREATTNEKA